VAFYFYGGVVPAKNDPSTPPLLTHEEGGGAAAVQTRLGRRNEVVIGRGVECDVVIKDVKASRRHCRLVRKDEGFLLEDLGSRNGTFVDGKKISAQVALKVQQTFKVGDTVFYLSQ
jgi:pSer/pThr/pTyr-binding forkhead associated (FHA) protein